VLRVGAETIAVIENSHHFHGFIRLGGSQIAFPGDLCLGGSDFVLAKAAQGIEVGQQVDVLRHIVATGEIAHGDRRDPGDEHSSQAMATAGGLDGLEQDLHAALPGQDGLIAAFLRRSMAHHQFIGEVVVFVDVEIKEVAGFPYGSK